MKKQLAAVLLSGCLLVATGCVNTKLMTAEEAAAMLESVYHMQFTCTDSEAVEIDGRDAYRYTFHDPSGSQFMFLAQVMEVDDVLRSVGTSDLTDQCLIAYATQWNALCDASGISYEQSGAVWKLTIAYSTDLDTQVCEISETAELIHTLLENAPIQVSQVDGYVHTDNIQVYYQTDPGDTDGVYLNGYSLVDRSACTVDYLAGNLQLWMRQDGLLEV